MEANDSDEPAKYAFTQGYKTFEFSRNALVSANKSKKAEPVRWMIEEPFGPNNPAKYLLNIPFETLYLMLDKEAAETTDWEHFDKTPNVRIFKGKPVIEL